MDKKNSIEATLVPREGWTGNPDSETAFDVTTDVLNLSLSAIHGLTDDEPRVRAFIYDFEYAVAEGCLSSSGHAPPYKLDVVFDVTEFFGVQNLSEITQAKLDQARRNRSLPIYSEKTITATFQPQRWNQRDWAEDDGPSEQFDVTENVLALDLDAIQALEDRSDGADQVVPYEIHGHEGPSSICVEDSIKEFFGVEDATEITDDMLEAAREVRGMDIDKQFEVTVLETVTRRKTFMTTAKTAEQARAQVTASTGPDQFAEGSIPTQPAVYKIIDTNVVEPEVAAEVERPRARG